jgi:hypothetical protein
MPTRLEEILKAFGPAAARVIEMLRKKAPIFQENDRLINLVLEGEQEAASGPKPKPLAKFCRPGTLFSKSYLWEKHCVALRAISSDGLVGLYSGPGPRRP